MTGLSACGTEGSAVGATIGGRDPDGDAPAASPGLLAYRTGRNFGPKATPPGATFSVFQAFARGAVPPGSIVRIAARGAPVSRQQCDNRVTWPDGSLRAAVFTWSHPHPIPSGERDRITLHATPGAWDNAAVASLRDVLAHDYRIQVATRGTTYTLRANNEIARGHNVRRVRAGAACTAWKIWGDLRAGAEANAAPQGQMWAKMFLTVTPDGQTHIENEIYCNKIANSTAMPIESYALLDGTRALSRHAKPFTLYTRNKLAAYDEDGAGYFSGPDLSKVVWAFPRPLARNPITTGLYDAMVTWWNHWTPTYIAAFRDPMPLRYAPHDGPSPVFRGGINGTGDHVWLGPMTSFAVMAMLSGRYDLHRQDRMMALASWSVCDFWCADHVTGLPPVFTNRRYSGLPAPIPEVGWGLHPTLQMAGGSNGGSVADASHAGLWWWWQYLSTGSEQALENVMEQGVGVLGCDVPDNDWYQRNPTIRGRKYYGSYIGMPTARAVAWELRNLSNAEWVAPDTHPMKPYLKDLLATQYDAVAGLIADNAADWRALCVYNTRDFNAPGYIPLLSPWMHDYLATSVVMDLRRGRIGRSHPIIAQHLIKWIYGRMVDGNFFNGAGPYRISPGKGPNARDNASYAKTWTEVYGFSAPPDMIYPLVDNPPVPKGLRKQTYQGPYIDPPRANPPNQVYVGHTYPNLALCAGCCGVIAGLGPYPEKVVAYLRPLIDDASEERWGATHGAQAWRLRPPA